MRDYGLIPTSIWLSGSRFRLLSAAAQRLYLFLFTQGDAEATGVLIIRMGRWAASAADLKRADLEDALEELAGSGWVLPDPDTDEVLIRWYMRETRVTSNPKWMKAIPRLVASVGSPAIRQALSHELAAARQRPDQPSLLDDVLPDPLSEGAPDGGTDGVPDGVSSLTYTYTHKPSTTSGTNRTTYGVAARARPGQAVAVAEGFDRFWAAYPRKVAKQAARRAWDKAARDTDPALIIAGAERYRDQPGREARYTKHPATWLNAGCWADDDEATRDGPGTGMTKGNRRVMKGVELARMYEERGE